MEFKGIFFDTKDFKLFKKKRLGKGSFGIVYLAENKKNNQLYAAKIIDVEDNFDGSDQMQIMRESSILFKLDHPAIVKFIGLNFRSFEDPTILQPAIITEYLKNGSLKKILDLEKESNADHAWTPSKKYICLLGISAAMKYLHSKGILHRDLKPENILMDDNFFPKVCDFGLSRFESFNLTVTSQIGTPMYMAPELMKNDGTYGAGVDVYAFSILAYEIVTGKEPFYELKNNGKNIDIFTLREKILHGERPQLSDDIPKNMKTLLQRCWNQNAEKRPSFSEIFLLLSSDFSYSPEDVEEDEVRSYLEMIEEENQDENEEPFLKSQRENKQIIDQLDQILKNKNQPKVDQINLIEKIKQKLVSQEEEILNLKLELSANKKSSHKQLKQLQNGLSCIQADLETFYKTSSNKNKSVDLNILKNQVQKLIEGYNNCKQREDEFASYIEHICNKARINVTKNGFTNNNEMERQEIFNNLIWKIDEYQKRESDFADKFVEISEMAKVFNRNDPEVNLQTLKDELIRNKKSRDSVLLNIKQRINSYQEHENEFASYFVDICKSVGIHDYEKEIDVERVLEYITMKKKDRYMLEDLIDRIEECKNREAEYLGYLNKICLRANMLNYENGSMFASKDEKTRKILIDDFIDKLDDYEEAYSQCCMLKYKFEDLKKDRFIYGQVSTISWKDEFMKMRLHYEKQLKLLFKAAPEPYYIEAIDKEDEKQ